MAQLEAVHRTFDHFVSRSGDIIKAFYGFNELSTALGEVFFLKAVWFHQEKLLEFLQCSSTTSDHRSKQWGKAVFTMMIIYIHCNLLVQSFLLNWHDDQVNHIYDAVMSFLAEVGIDGFANGNPFFSKPLWKSVIEYFYGALNFLVLVLTAVVLTMRDFPLPEFCRNVENNYGNIPRV